MVRAKSVCLLRLFVGVTIAVGATDALGETAVWDAPDLDRWLHQGETTPGTKADPSVFTAFGVGAPFSQGRSGVVLLGFDTSDQITPVDPERYRVDAVRVTATTVNDGRQVVYDPTADTVAAIAGGTDDPGKPIELFGVGFANDYERLGFGGSNDGLAPEFEENSPPMSAGSLLEQTFNVFPLGDDGSGQLGNVFNSPGGEGEFTLDEFGDPVLVTTTKSPWYPSPWAVGEVDGLSAGEILPGNTPVVFDVDLTTPGVDAYFRESLADGQVAVTLSGLHDLTGFHTGGVIDAFPAFHSKESLFAQFDPSLRATLEIDFAVLPLPGDYDGDGDVDTGDRDAWAAAYGTVVADPGLGADGNADGVVDAADFAYWRDRYSASAIAVPEPGAEAYTLIALATAAFCWGTSALTSPHDSEDRSR